MLMFNSLLYKKKKKNEMMTYEGKENESRKKHTITNIYQFQ